MNILENLYYGNISPHERYIKQGSKVQKLVKLICKMKKNLILDWQKSKKKHLKNLRIVPMNWGALLSEKRSQQD